MLLIDQLELSGVFFAMVGWTLTLLLNFLPLDCLLTDFRDSVFPVLSVTTEDTLVKCVLVVILQLQGVHLGTLIAMERFRA